MAKSTKSWRLFHVDSLWMLFFHKSSFLQCLSPVNYHEQLIVYFTVIFNIVVKQKQWDNWKSYINVVFIVALLWINHINLAECSDDVDGIQYKLTTLLWWLPSNKYYTVSILYGYSGPISEWENNFIKGVWKWRKIARLDTLLSDLTGANLLRFAFN